MQPQPTFADAPIVTAQAWAIADAAGRLLYEHEASLPREAASTTKIMTAFLVIRHAQTHPEVLNEIITFSSRADNTVGSTAGVRTGERIKVRDLLYGLLLPSGNDASVALGEHFGSRLGGNGEAATEGEPESSDRDKSYDQFVAAMNQVAQEMGLQHAHYKNTHGLPDPEHVISAADLLRLAHEARKLDLFREICSTRQYGCTVTSGEGYRRNLQWKNTNRLLAIAGYDGVKTGTTSAAGACLVASGVRDGDRLTVVILGSSSSAARYADVRNLFRWAWQKRQANAGPES